MDKNCRNCGAPHDNKECKYCGTLYKPIIKNQAPLQLIRAKSHIDKSQTINPITKAKQLDTTHKIILILLGLCSVGLLIYYYYKRKQNGNP